LTLYLFFAIVLLDRPVDKQFSKPLGDPLVASLRPVERKKIYETIVEQMRDMVESHTWKPGERLPSERELTQMLEVGRTSVREALRILEAMGYIDIRPGDGSYVRDNVVFTTSLQKMLEAVQGDELFVEVLEARELLEAQIAFLAAENASPEEVADLEAIVDRQERSMQAGLDGVDENIEFHLRVTEITGNRVLVEMQQFLFKLAHQGIQNLFQITGLPQESVRQHREIIAAVSEHQSAKAQKLMVDHVRARYNLAAKQDNSSAEASKP
jgi:GntR family transcriptional repressor for pyruvate dehydrogenase complex